MKKTPARGVFFIVAEREGFEPPVPRGTPVFKTGVIDHSTIFPGRFAGAKLLTTFGFHKFFAKKLGMPM